MTNAKHTEQRVPKLYKISGKILQKVKEEGGSLKTLVYEAKHPNLKAVYALVLETLRHGPQLDYLVWKTQILLQNPRLNPWVVRVLMTELLWHKTFSAVSPPQRIVQRYKDRFLSELANIPKEGANEDASYSAKTANQVRYVRVNTLRDTLENVISWFVSDGWEDVTPSFSSKKTSPNLRSGQFMRDTDIPNLLVFPHDFRFYETDLFKQGVIVLQDKASCVPPLLLNPPPGSVVLDMCAAPGMKTSHIAAMIQNKGKVIGIEINKRRFASLRETVEQVGASCVQTVNADALRYAGRDMSEVEYILLDPPCSGSGMVNRKNVFQEKEDKDPHRLSRLSNFQCSLLRHAMTNFPKVKRIVYSTCSVHSEENEAVVDSVLKSNPPNFIPVQNPPYTSWMTRGSTDYEFGPCSFYTRPSTHSTNGFFVILFDRSEEDYVSSENTSTEQVTGEEELVSEQQKTKQKRKKVVEQGKKEKTVNQPDDVVLKMIRAMQKKPESNVSEACSAVENGSLDQSVEKKKKKKSKTGPGNGISVNTEELSIETAEGLPDAISGNAGQSACESPSELKNKTNKKTKKRRNSVEVNLVKEKKTKR